MLIDADQKNFKTITENTEKVLVYFTAPWCMPCKALGPKVEKLAEGMTVLKVNVDEQSDLAAEFRIRSVPTLMIFKSGQPVDTMVGNVSEGKLQEFTKA